jgi:dienelactone hydrolase
MATDVEFPSEGVRCAAWLYRPTGEGRLPLVVMAHGFSATRELRLDAYAERFCAAGLGVLLFDYRHFGASDGAPRQLLDVGRQHADYHAAVAFARSLDWVDPDRVALFGSSFSGGHVIAVAADDQRVAAIVSQCPYTDGLASLGKIPPVTAARVTALALKDQLGAAAGRGPTYVPAVGEPGSVAAMSTPDARPGFEALRPAQTRWENRVAARVFLQVPLYRPGRLARRLSCPALFCVCDNDSVAPAKQTLKLVAAAPRGEIKRYPVGHFEVYLGEAFERAVLDQTAFLRSHLGLG